MSFKEWCHKNKFIVFDGAMGTMLQCEGLKAGQLPEIFNITRPEVVARIHRMYLEAGADVITTNTFGANELKLEGYGYTVEEVVGRAVELAKEVAGGKPVALDIGPTGQLLEPVGTLSFDRAYEIFARQIKAGVHVGADMVLIETIGDLYEARAAILAAKENSSLPVVCTLTFQQEGRTLMGTDPLTAVNVLEGLGVDALGVNCSLGPRELLPIVEEFLRYAHVPVIVQPNAGLPKIINGETVYDMQPDEFARYMRLMAEKGVRILGGCCGTNPDFIRALRKALENVFPASVKPMEITAVSSSSKTIIIGENVRIIGERINPTGKKKLKEALREGRLDYIISEAIAQKEAGADILDVNVGLPEINEKEMMIKAVREIQAVVNLPLQIDSSEPDVIEAAVRIYNGKPLVNSVNGKLQSMESIFPVVKRYGACVVGLTLDEDGIPQKAEKRVEIARRIVKTAEDYGIPRRNVLIDCLVVTVSAQQQEVMETLKAMAMVKEELGVKTVLGISNVSFGFPKRGLLNRTYLAMALAYGLDAPIINPLATDMMDTVNAFRVLANQDREGREYIRIYSSVEPEVQGGSRGGSRNDLKMIIIEGKKDEAAESTRLLLKDKEPMEIVNDYLIPALDVVGDKYEKGEFFLPQLIRSAETVQKAFEVIKERLSNNEKKISKGKILLATVEGDIHDIGKNIVKVLLENYGFEVVDLGKDVPVGEVVRVAREQKIRLVGLSALMTTTVKKMEETIAALRKAGIPCRVMVGGAVLNQEYADMIGADFYAKDAMEGVKIAQKVFGS